MKVVVDTNVIISALLTSNGYVAEVMKVCRDETLQLVIPKPQLVEIGQVLHRPKIQKYLRWNDATIRDYIHDLSTFAHVVPATTFVKVSEDPIDNMLFAAAIEGGAAYIVSGDQGHVLAVRDYRGIQTISPKAFVETILALPQKM